MTTLGVLAFLPVNAFAIPHARSVDMSMESYGKCLALTFCISLCLSYPLGWLADRLHPIRLGIVALSLYLCVTIWAWAYATTAETFAIAFVAHALASGIYVTGVSSLGQRLYPQSHFAQFTSAAGILMSFGTIGMSPLVGHVIDITGAVYRHTFLIGGTLSILALSIALHTYKQFSRPGGVTHYQPPPVAGDAPKEGFFNARFLLSS